jgi:hypothetical protein
MAPLILTCASASRPSGQWREDDYDVLEDGVVVGRIFHRPARHKSGRGYGRVVITATSAARRTDTSRPARRRWPR